MLLIRIRILKISRMITAKQKQIRNYISQRQALINLAQPLQSLKMLQQNVTVASDLVHFYILKQISLKPFQTQSTASAVWCWWHISWNRNPRCNISTIPATSFQCFPCFYRTRSTLYAENADEKQKQMIQIKSVLLGGNGHVRNRVTLL